MSQTKKIRMQRRIAEMRQLKAKTGVDVLEFNSIHYRIVGKNAIDYWPGSGTVWPLESRCKGFKAEPAEVCELANFNW